MTYIPRVVRARGPDQEDVAFLVSSETIQSALEDGEADKVAQFLTLVQTGVPTLGGDPGLLKAHTLWQGLERPLGNARSGDDHHAYVLSPEVTYTVDTGGQVQQSNAPRGSVFVVLVEIPDLADEKVESWSQDAGEAVVGMVHDWCWVDADEREPDQPSRPGKRFQARCWHRRGH